MSIPKIPLGEWTNSFVEWLTIAWAGFFTFIANTIGGLLDMIVKVLSVGPPIVLMLVLTFIVIYTSRWQLGIFTIFSLLLIDNLGYWDSSIQTLAIVLPS